MILVRVTRFGSFSQGIGQHLEDIQDNVAISKRYLFDTLIPMIPLQIDLLAILHKSLDRAFCYTFLYTRFDRLALELLSLLCTFENSTDCSKISFNF